MLKKCDIYYDDEKHQMLLIPIDDNKPVKIVYEGSEELTDAELSIFLEGIKPWFKEPKGSYFIFIKKYDIIYYNKK